MCMRNLHEMGDLMKCEYCGFEFDAPKCPNCGAFAPKIDQPSGYDPVRKTLPSNSYTQYYAGVKVRSVLVCIILTIITCGLYSLLWISYLNDESNFLSDEQEPTSGTTAVLLIIFTCGIYGFYWVYKQCKRIDRAFTIRNFPPPHMSLAYCLLLIIPYIGLFIVLGMMQNDINNLAVM